MATYNYTVTASGNSYYLWNGHGLVDAQNPDLFFRAGDSVTITKGSAGHPMRITNNAAPSVGIIDESGGQIVVDPVIEGIFTYFCTSHPSVMRATIVVSAAYTNEGPEDGYGTGPLIGHDTGPLSMNEIRTKINEIITKGGVGGTTTGGGSISVSTDAPGSPSDGDLWWDSDTASLYVYFAERSAWIQTNGAVGGGANFSTGWVNTDGTENLAASKTLTFDHNLGTTDLTTQIWVADNASGDNAFQVINAAATSYGSNAPWNVGASITNITTTSLSVTIAEDSVAKWSSSGNLQEVDVAPSTGKYIKVVASAAGGGGGGGGGGTPAGSDREIQFNDNGALGANANLKFDGSTAFLPRLAVGEGAVGGDEGAEIFLKHAVTNSTLAGEGVAVDIYQNKLRFFEYGGSFRGAYIDLTECGAELSGGMTNLLAGGGDASIKVSATAPSSAEDGDLWFNTTQAELYVYVDAESAWIQTNGGGGSGGGNFNTGWVNTDGTTAVDNGADLNFNHNLGTTDLTFAVYVADDAYGTNATLISTVDTRVNPYVWTGAQVQNLTTTSFRLRLGGGQHSNNQSGYSYLYSPTGGQNPGESYTGKYIKVVASAGGGGAGPRAHVSFDGKNSNINSTMENVFNVSSITDDGVGKYTVTFTNPISNPVVSATISSDQSFASFPSNNTTESKIQAYEKSSTLVKICTGRGSYHAIDCPVDLLVF